MQGISGLSELFEEVRYRRGPDMLWPSGPEVGLYFAYEEAALATFLQDFFDATGWSEPAHVYGTLPFPNGFPISGEALGSDGFRRLASGGVVVFAPPVESAADRALLHCVIQDAWFTASELERRCVVYVPERSTHEARKVVEQALREAMSTLRKEITVRGEIERDGNIAPRVSAAHDLEKFGPWRARGFGCELTPRCRVALQAAVKGHSRGLILVGTSGHDKRGVEPLVGALIAMTNAVGAPAYIHPYEAAFGFRFGQTGGPQDLELPGASSIKAALETGFKRLVVPCNEGVSSELLHAAQQVLVIAVCPGASVQAIKGLPDPYSVGFDCLRPHVLAALAVGALDFGDLRLHTMDLYVRPEEEDEEPEGPWYETLERREIRWEDQLQPLLDAARDESARARLAASICDVFGDYADASAFFLKNGLEGAPRNF